MKATNMVKAGLMAVREVIGQGPEDLAADPAPDAIDLLVSQHREVDALFGEFEDAGPKARKTRERLVEIIIEKLEMHTKIEEKVFYPAVRSINNELVLESFEEHDHVKYAIKRLRSTRGNEDSLEARVNVLKELVKRHVDEEQDELFPSVRKELDKNELERLGARMHRLMVRKDRRSAGGQAPVRRMSQRRAAATKVRPARKKTAHRGPKAKTSGAVGKKRARAKK